MAKKKSAKRPEAVTIDSMERLKAIADPLRQQIFEQLAIAPATTKQVAVALGLQPTRLYHHVATLESCGLIRLVKTRPVRGATEKYYEAVASCLRIDRRALPGKAAQLVGDEASLNVVDGLWTNIRSDIAEYLQEADCEAADAEEEILFMQAEIEVDAETAAALRAKMLKALKELEKSAKAKKGKQSRKYRMMMGWYPKTTEKE